MSNKTSKDAVPTGWTRMKLGDIGGTLSGLTGKSKDDFGHGKPYVPYMNVYRNSHIDRNFLSHVAVKDNEKQTRLEYGDYIFTTSSETPDEVGMSTVVNTDLGETYLNSFCFIFRPDKQVLNPDFGGYLFRGPLFRKEISTHAKGSTRFNLSKRDFLNVEITFPQSELEQERITKILSVTDEQIRQTTNIISETEKLKKGLMREFFTRGIGHSQFKVAEVGEIPEKWGTYKLEELATITRGGSPRPIDDFITNAPDGLNWLKIGDIEQGAKYISRTTQKIRKEGLSKTTMVKSGDFILSNSMSFGRPYIMKIDACIHDGWLAFKDIKTNLIGSEFLYYLLSSEVLQNSFSEVAAGSGVKNLKRESVSNIKVALPLIDEQEKIVQILSSIDGKIAANQKLKSTHLELRKGLMQTLLSGQKRTV